MKRLVGFVLMIIFLSSTTFFSIAAAVQNSVDTTLIKQGVVSVQFSGRNDVRRKVMIAKGSSQYVYNMTADSESFPLQLGNGTYKINLLENQSGNKYKVVSSYTVDLDLKNENAVFLNSIQIIKWDNESKAVKKAKDLTKNMKNDEDKVKAIYEYITKNFTYDFDKLSELTPDYVPDLDKTFESNKGICYDYSSVLAGMLRSIGIPAKLVKGYAPNVKEYHAWNEVYIQSQGKWVTIDTTVDSQLRQAKKKVSMIKDNTKYKKVNEY